MLAAVLLCGLLAGLLAGGNLRGFSRVSFRGAPLILLLLALQVVLPQVRGERMAQLLRVAWMASFPALMWLGWLNRRSPGMLLALVGLALNALVIATNGGMPVSLEVARLASGGSPVSIPAGDFAHTALTSSTRLAWLADVIASPGPRGIATLLSAGDVVLFSGVVCFISSAMTSKRESG
jgi:hypothetical protein